MTFELMPRWNAAQLYVLLVQVRKIRANSIDTSHYRAEFSSDREAIDYFTDNRNKLAPTANENITHAMVVCVANDRWVWDRHSDDWVFEQGTL